MAPDVDRVLAIENGLMVLMLTSQYEQCPMRCTKMLVSLCRSQHLNGDLDPRDNTINELRAELSKLRWQRRRRWLRPRNLILAVVLLTAMWFVLPNASFHYYGFGRGPESRLAVMLAIGEWFDVKFIKGGPNGDEALIRVGQFANPIWQFQLSSQDS